MLLADFW